jgi:hypothetical protein
LFEEFFFSSVRHARFETFDQVVPAAFEKEPRVVGRLSVSIIRGEASDARAETAMNVVLQARARMRTRQVNRAGWNEKTLVDKMQNAAG